MSYKPSLVDIAWMQRLVASLNVGGIWGYSSEAIFFKKTAEKTMTLTSAPRGDAIVDEQIARNKVVMKAAGIKFEDRRTRR